jgi:Ca2+/Na+ antiporter
MSYSVHDVDNLVADLKENFPSDEVDDIFYHALDDAKDRHLTPDDKSSEKLLGLFLTAVSAVACAASYFNELPVLVTIFLAALSGIWVYIFYKKDNQLETIENANDAENIETLMQFLSEYQTKKSKEVEKKREIEAEETKKLEDQVIKMEAADIAKDAIDIIVASTRALQRGQDNSIMLTTIDTELKSLILNSRAIDEINNTPALLDDLVIAQSIIHDLGITDPYIGIRFGKVLRNNN